MLPPEGNKECHCVFADMGVCDSSAKLQTIHPR